MGESWSWGGQMTEKSHQKTAKSKFYKEQMTSILNLELFQKIFEKQYF